MNKNIFNRLNFNKINNSESDNDSKGCLFLIMFFSKKLWATIILLLIAWIPDTRLWLSIVLTIIAAVNLLLPNTRDNEIMGWARVAMIVIASLVTVLLF
jgi:hypothetical protein